ncbi:nitric-oxide synthase [Aspergillus neoniger CBS 115656]|uniref:nitric-oxide synthase (NADPH) n=1 Tax=Aspergillus neoniger (strain CBS 115656) TaxID=1448310 RepID=A0A318YBX9_ASPNB|nr:nitric-oxide synthase [Aspergillus neoniger CBS 115656]PYH31484.1 nitric-oxide synthase [Aspergillus neoniger CBS 115656]
MPGTEIGHDSGATPSIRCPFDEFERILEKNPILAPTGCTEKFCQAGRLIHSAEPKVGENRPLEVVKNEAVAFLWQLWQEGIYTEDRYLERRAQVLEEIARSTKTTIVWDQECKRVGKTSIWTQSAEELRYGLRLAWKNSRRCIMRSRYQGLGLCDLRHIHTSVGMATALLEEVTKAFNDGQIEPTVFVFPPKSVNGSGPRFWNKQVLNFAGVRYPLYWIRNPQYELEDGSIVGDPSNVKLTQDIIDLGWAPPRPKTPWDLLPIVAMAESDAPALVEVPDDLCRLIAIRHPDYPGFNELGLRWYQFPALSRLGFDIGGVQYMDAEIGVRNLADMFRFDALPEVVKAIGFDINAYRAKPEYADIRELEDLPDYEQLRWRSRAQAELNYAVRWSFLQHGVTCFDDEHAAKKGYRLNSDHYWLSPPQGSIIPVWHRGGAPNYQPKPMICRNRYDPVNSWQRRKGSTEAVPALLVRNGNTWVTEALTSFATEILGPKRRKLTESPSKEQPCTVHLSYCSQGTTARTLAERLHRRLKRSARGFRVKFSTLDALDLALVETFDTILLVASTTGSGAFPANGANFAKALGHFRHTLKVDFSRVRLSVFGVGDSAYPNFNAAAITAYDFFHHLNILPIAGGLIKAYVASEALPLRMFNRWSDAVESALMGGKGELTSDPEEAFVTHAEMLRNFSEATVTSKASSRTHDGLVLLTLDGIECADMTHQRLLPTNSSSHVSRAITALEITDPQLLIPFSGEGLQHLFAGFRPADENLFHAVVHLAQRHRVLDLACLVPSNREKKRVQCFLLDKCNEIRTKLVEQEGYVYVCGSAAMAEGVQANLSEILVGNVKQIMGERYVEEVF